MTGRLVFVGGASVSPRASRTKMARHASSGATISATGHAWRGRIDGLFVERPRIGGPARLATSETPRPHADATEARRNLRRATTPLSNRMYVALHSQEP